MTASGTAAVDAAFDRFRTQHGPARQPAFPPRHSEADAMCEEDGLIRLLDGAFASHDVPEYLQRMERDGLPVPPRLWVVRPDDVVHSNKFCDFGTTRASGELKHTNLTGGGIAFAGGELLMIDENTLIVSGDSGRYGPRDAQEMIDVAQAFKESGYIVYSMGFDEGANVPLKFVGPQPKRV